MATFGTSMSIGHISSELKEERNAVRRAVYALLDEGFLYRVEGGRRYALSHQILALGVPLGLNGRYAELLTPFLEELASETGEVACIDVIEDSDVVIQYVASHPDASMQSEVAAGMRLPGHCSAAGRVILAENFAALAPRFGSKLQRFNERTVATPIDLFDLARREQAQGYGIAMGEFVDHVACVGTAILGPDGAYSRGISIGVLRNRLIPQYAKELGDYLVAACTDFNRKIIERSS